MDRSIFPFILRDILRNRFVLAYAFLLAVMAWSVFSLEDDSRKGVLTLLHLVLLATPLVALVFSTTYLYNSGEFIELLLSQPGPRARIWNGLSLGLFTGLSAAYLIGAGIPLLLFVETSLALMLLVIGLMMTAVFVAIGCLCNITVRDRAKGIGVVMLLWLFLSLMFDGLVLFLSFQLADYPIEVPMVIVTALNPVDLSRIFIILQLDVSAMLGYTGAIFRQFFGADWGMLAGLLLLSVWVVVPYLLSLRAFIRRDW